MRKTFFLLFVCCTTIPSLCQINEGSFYYGTARSNILSKIYNLKKAQIINEYKYDTSIYVVKYFTAVTGVDTDNVNFDTDLSQFLFPLYWNYNIYKGRKACDTLVYTIWEFEPFSATYDFADTVSVADKKWSSIMSAINKENWNMNKIIIYYIQNFYLPLDISSYIFLYKGKSYFFSKAKFVEAMDYLKKHYTLSAYKKLIGDIIIK